MHAAAGFHDRWLIAVEGEVAVALLAAAGAESGRLVYRGEVGTGFDDDSQAEMAEKLLNLGHKTASVEVVRVETRGVDG